MLVRYYEQDHPVLSAGSIFRGYRDCYNNKTIQEPNVSMLEITMARARRKGCEKEHKKSFKML